MEEANFLVDPKLTALLSESYRSTELALKELVDNAWDAEATEVFISLPEILSNEAIIIEDNGSGMTKNEVATDFLTIARSRIATRGERTASLNRKVKGRKGIGKFAGFVLADEMNVETVSKQTVISFIINRSTVETSGGDLEHVKIPLQIEKNAGEKEHGTKVILSQLIPTRTFPKEDKLREILFIEYGRCTDFNIFINGFKIGIEDLPGETFEEAGKTDTGGEYRLVFKIAENKSSLRNPGIAIRVDGKIVGQPSFLGLENDERIPAKLLKRIYGEIEADGLESDVTADWGAILENSKGLAEIRERTSEKVVNELKNKYFRDFNLQKARLQKKINEQIQTLPEYKREFAHKEIERVLTKFYEESDEKVETIANVVITAIERDEYFYVLEKIEGAKHLEVELLAEALEHFGILDSSLMLRQFAVREKVLDDFEELISRSETQEIEVHKVIEKNHWMLGREYYLMSSNKTLKRVVEEYLNEKFTDKEREDKRPDLLLAELYSNEILLVEFKRPGKTIGRDDENQAEKYRDDLIKYLGDKKISVLVIGGRIDTKYSRTYQNNALNLITYNQISSNARSEIEWLLDDMRKM